ncbi:hypothetical protein ACQP1K_26630 [Sphaerimonospora sp. CA-214678]|uniref:hypothetical protein n=1 Tax=Sphaerimonospora sp. CA-214678 TaxID=3240029 RepID=UPI003D947524
MKEGLKVALAILAGYYLGRRRKLGLMGVLALIIVANRLRGEGTAGGLLQQGVKALGGASPELGKITERVRGDLLDVGKAAVMAATSKQIDALSDRLHERAEALRHPKAPTAGRPAPGTAEPEAEEGHAEAEEEGFEEEPYEEEEPEEIAAEQRPRPRVQRPQRPVFRRR